MSQSQRRRRVRRRRRSRFGKRGFVLAALRDFDVGTNIAWACTGVIDAVPIAVGKLRAEWEDMHIDDKLEEGEFAELLAEVEGIRDWVFERLLPGEQACAT